MTMDELRLLAGGSYRHIKVLEAGPHKGHFAHTALQMFTTGIMISDNVHGCPMMRWCYDSFVPARDALAAWDGVGDPPGEWIKYKGPDGERSRVPGPFEE